MVKSKQVCSQKSCPAYQEAMRTISQSGQSAQVLYVEPNFIATPSEYDVFYDCFSSESDYPSERCRRNGMFCPAHFNQECCLRSSPKPSNKFIRDCGGDGAHNLRNSLQQVAYTARILLKTFDNSNNHRHYKRKTTNTPNDPIANEEERVVTADFRPGDNSANTKELHLDPYTVRIEPISLNIPLRIELRAAPGTPYNTPIKASYEAHISTGQLIGPMDAAYCMEPIRTAIIAAPGPMSHPPQLSNVRPFEAFQPQSRTSTSLWDSNLPLPPPPPTFLPRFDDYTDDYPIPYGNCALTCIEMAKQMYTNDKDTQVKTICGCCTSQVLFMPMADLNVVSPVEESEKSTIIKTEADSMAVSQQTQWAQTSGLTIEDQPSILEQSIELPRPPQQAQASQTLPLSDFEETRPEKSLQLTQSSQTSLIFDFAKEHPQSAPQEEELPSEMTRNAMSPHAQSSQTSLIFDFEIKKEQPQSTPQEELPSEMTKNAMLPQPQSSQSSQIFDFDVIKEHPQSTPQEEELHTEMAKTAPSPQPQSSQSSQIFDFDITKEHPQSTPQEELPTETTKNATLPLLSQVQKSIVEHSISSMHSIRDEASPTMQSPQSSHIQSLSDSSISEPIKKLPAPPVQPPPPKMRSSQGTQTIRSSLARQTGRLSGRMPPPPPPTQLQEIKEEPKLSKISESPIKTYRLAMPQHKFLEICAPCRYDPSPLIDEHGNVFCPRNCGCCLCPWRARPVKTEAERASQEHGKIKICKCRDKGTIFTKFNENERRCSNTEFFDFCPCREKAEAKYLELYGEEMWTPDEHLTISPGNRVVRLSEVIEFNRNAGNY